MIQRNFVVFTASAFLFLIVFFTSSLIASQFAFSFMLNQLKIAIINNLAQLIVGLVLLRVLTLFCHYSPKIFARLSKPVLSVLCMAFQVICLGLTAYILKLLREQTKRKTAPFPTMLIHSCRLNQLFRIGYGF